MPIRYLMVKQDRYLSNVANGPAMWSHLARLLDFDPAIKLPQVGDGSRGTAYELPDGRVIKITRDHSEARAAAVLRDSPDPAGRVVRVDHVYGLEGRLHADGPGGTRADGYAIVMEKLDRPDPQMAAWADDWPDMTVDPVNVRSFLAEIESAGTNWDTEKSDTWATFSAWLTGVAQYLEDRNIQFSDLHEGNVMSRAGAPVLIDLGYSQSPGRLADMLDETVARIVKAAGHDRPVTRRMPPGARADQLALLRLFDLKGLDELKVQDLRGEPVADTPFVRDLIAKNHGRPLTREQVEQAAQEAPGDVLGRLARAVQFVFKPYGGFVQKLWESKPNVEFIVALPVTKFQHVFGFSSTPLVDYYVGMTNHPTAGPDLMTIGWVRYTDLGDDAWVDEIQTDLTNRELVAHEPDGFGRLGDLLGGLDDLSLWIGEQFVREARARGVGRIFMPTLQIKRDRYNAQPVPPRSAFEDLPRRLRFRKMPYGKTGLPAGDVDMQDIQQAVRLLSRPNPKLPPESWAVTPDGSNWLVFGRTGQTWQYFGELPEHLMARIQTEPVAVADLPEGLQAAFDDIQVDAEIPADEPVWMLAAVQERPVPGEPFCDACDRPAEDCVCDQAVAKRPDSDGYFVDQVLAAIPRAAWDAVVRAAGWTGQGDPAVNPAGHSFEWAVAGPGGPVGLTARGSFVTARDGEWVIRAVRLDDPDQSAELHDLFTFDVQRDARAVLVAAMRVLRAQADMEPAEVVSQAHRFIQAIAGLPGSTEDDEAIHRYVRGCRPAVVTKPLGIPAHQTVCPIHGPRADLPHALCLCDVGGGP